MINPIRLPHRVRSIISSSFHHFGLHCASHPKRVILISCVVITSLFYPALALYSSSNLPYALTSFSSFFDAYPSDLQEIWQDHEALHILEDSDTRTRCGLERTLRIERIFVPKTEPAQAGAATPATLQFASNIEDRIRAILSKAPPSLPCVTTTTKDCLTLSPRLFFQDHLPSTPSDVLEVINASPNITLSNIPLGTPMVFSARHSPDDQPEKGIEHVAFLALTYFFVEKDCLDQEGHKKWLEMLQTITRDNLGSTSVTPFVFQKPRILALQYDPTVSRPSHFSAISLFLYLSYLGVFLSFSGSLRRMDTVHSRFGLTFTALIEIIASTITSISVCALAGFRITMVPWGILPLTIVFVGAENMFLLVDAVTSTPVTLPVKQRIATGLAVAGTSNTLNTVSYNSILGVIAFFATGAIRQFCSFAIVLLVAHWFLIHTFFIAVLSIDLQRLELSDMLTQDKASKPTILPQKPTNQPTPSKRRQTMNRIQQRLRVVPSKNGSLMLMLAVTVTLYYVTYPFPSRPEDEADPLAFLQHAMRRPAPIVEETPSAALNLWNILNPEKDPLVHIRIETPMVVALNVQGTSGSREHRQDIRNVGSIGRRAFWLLTIVILPIGTTTGSLYLLLLYLLKDADLLEAQRNKPEAGSEEAVNPTTTSMEGHVSFTTLPRAFATDIEFIASNNDISVVALVSTENELVIWNEGYDKLDVRDLLSSSSSTDGAQSCITSLAVDWSGRYCAIGTGTGVVAIWRIPPRGLSLDKVPRSVAITMAAPVTDLAFVPVFRGRTGSQSSGIAPQPKDFSIVVTCDNGTAYHMNPNSSSAVHSIPPSHAETTLRSFLVRSPDNDHLYIAYTYHDGTVEIFSRTSSGYNWDSVCVLQAGNQMDPVANLSINSVDIDGTSTLIVAAATSAGVVSLWDPVKSECIYILDHAYGDVVRLRIAPVSSQPCPRCGELTPDAFVLTFSVGHTVFVHRASLSSMGKRCVCPITRQLFGRDSFGRRSRSGSTVSSASSSPSRSRLKLPSTSISVSATDTPAFPISGHGAYSRRAGSEKDANRRTSESLLTINSQPEEHDWLPHRTLMLGNSPSGATTSDSIWRSLVVDIFIDISCERGSWDLIDSQRLIGLRRRSRLTKSDKFKLPLSSPTGKGELTPAVLERWELWSYNPTKPDMGVKVSSLSDLAPSSSAVATKGSFYPRLPFTRISSMVVRPSGCVVGLGNTAGIVNLLPLSKT